MSDKFLNKYRIKSARAAWWDYRKNGIYFVTICTRDRENYFGKISPAETMHASSLLVHSDIGKIARQFWLDIPLHFPYAILDEFVIMPNHVHGIIIIDKPENGGNTGNIIVNGAETGHALSLKQTSQTSQTSQRHHRFRNQGKNTISAMVGSFKSAVTRWCNQNGYPFGWQSRFHDHIVRNNIELQRIRKYIINNPENLIKAKSNNNSK